MLSRLRFFVPFALALICLTFVGVLFASAADLPPNTRLATEADLPAMRAAGIRNPVVGMAWNPNSAQVGLAVGEAKQFLLTRQSCVNGAGITGEDPKNCILKLDASFATKLAELFKNDPRFTGATILSAYRSEAGEMRVSGKNSGSHRRGCAVDLVGGSWGKFTCGDACQYVVANSSRLKVGLPYYPRIPGEANHLEPAGIACSGSPGANPNDPTQAPPTSAAPTSPLSNAIRQALGMQQQPQMPPQPTLPAQPASTPTNTAQPANTSPSSQVTPISDLLNNNSNTNTNTKSTSTTPTSTLDLIEEFLNPVSDSITIGTAVDIDLNPDTRDAISLNGKKPTSTLNATGTLAIYQTLSVPQTFTSNDLANNPVSGYSSGENTFIWKILETMKNTLLLALSYLRPFGGFTQTQVSAE